MTQLDSKDISQSYGILIVANFFVAKQSNWGPHLDIAATFTHAGWKVIKTSCQRNRILRLIDMLWTVWHHRQCYVLAQVDVYSGLAFVWAEAVCLLLLCLQKPYILALHGGNLPDFSARHPGRVRRILKHATIVTVPSAYLGDEMCVYRDDLIFLPNPVALDHYPFALRDKPQPRLCWLRAFRYIYNPQMAVRAVAELIADFPDLRLTMIGHDSGDGTLQAVQSLAQELGVASHLHIIPGVAKEDVPAWLVKNDIFLNTTTIDNTPVSVIEAQACGLCVICTRVGGLSHMLQEGVDALLVPSNDSQALADAIRRLLTEPQLAAELSRNGRQNAQQYDMQSVMRQWAVLFNRVIEESVQM